ncbi:unnamed protein product [Gadus morhua 'NCC']
MQDSQGGCSSAGTNLCEDTLCSPAGCTLMRPSPSSPGHTLTRRYHLHAAKLERVGQARRPAPEAHAALASPSSAPPQTLTVLQDLSQGPVSQSRLDSLVHHQEKLLAHALNIRPTTQPALQRDLLQGNDPPPPGPGRTGRARLWIMTERKNCQGPGWKVLCRDARVRGRLDQPSARWTARGQRYDCHVFLVAEPTPGPCRRPAAACMLAVQSQTCLVARPTLRRGLWLLGDSCRRGCPQRDSARAVSHRPLSRHEGARPPERRRDCHHTAQHPPPLHPGNDKQRPQQNKHPPRTRDHRDPTHRFTSAAPCQLKNSIYTPQNE